jgi:hypothetical protein
MLTEDRTAPSGSVLPRTWGDHVDREWRKSSRSDHQGSCVEVRGDLAAVRDSKNLAGPTLRVDVGRLTRYVRVACRT